MAERPVVTFRADPDLHLKLEQLRATFPKQQWAEVFVWLFSEPRVVEMIRERVNGG
ncbi:MAG: hypothetical protein K0R44_18 [Thermomicrobiales bacterium]|jgi:hypothetical protein|nr:hypothetical protein [Thermomicrobiales bacterium]MDF3014793.1 hypothetical protein [Thermomicrobiales bacterium]